MTGKRLKKKKTNTNSLENRKYKFDDGGQGVSLLEFKANFQQQKKILLEFCI